MKMYLYADKVFFDSFSNLESVFASVYDHSCDTVEYMIVLVEYGPKGEMPDEAHLVFRGTETDARRAPTWN